MKILIAMNANGLFAPSCIIFPIKNMIEQLVSQVHFYQGGYKSIYSRIGSSIKRTNPTPLSTVLLILDGHYSHTRNIDIIEKTMLKVYTYLLKQPKSFS